MYQPQVVCTCYENIKISLTVNIDYMVVRVVTKSCCEWDFDYPVVNIYSAIGESEILVILRHVQTTQSWCIHSPSPSSLPLL